MSISSMREMAFKCVYSQEIQKEEIAQDYIELFFNAEEINDKNVKKYIKEIVNGIETNKEDIISLISNNLKKDWNINRISKIDLALLKIAIYEINYKKIEYKIIINDVVELAKKYGTQNSYNFINGVLASIVKEQNNEV